MSPASKSTHKTFRAMPHTAQHAARVSTTGRHRAEIPDHVVGDSERSSADCEASVARSLLMAVATRSTSCAPRATSCAPRSTPWATRAVRPATSSTTSPTRRAAPCQRRDARLPRVLADSFTRWRSSDAARGTSHIESPAPMAVPVRRPIRKRCPRVCGYSVMGVLLISSPDVGAANRLSKMGWCARDHHGRHTTASVLRLPGTVRYDRRAHEAVTPCGRGRSARSAK